MLNFTSVELLRLESVGPRRCEKLIVVGFCELHSEKNGCSTSEHRKDTMTEGIRTLGRKCKS